MTFKLIRPIMLALLSFSTALSYAADTPAHFASRDPRYRLQPDDVVEIQYRYTPEYNQVATIQPDGFVTLPLVGDMKLGGFDLDRAKQEIITRASTRLKDPEVTLVLKEFEKPKFTVTGEVTTPGRYELRGSTTVIEALAMAGGFKTATAKHSQVLLVRRIDDTYAETKILDIKNLINTRSFSEDQTLRAGDILLVPQNTLSKVERIMKWANFGVYANPALR